MSFLKKLGAQMGKPYPIERKRSADPLLPPLLLPGHSPHG